MQINKYTGKYICFLLPGSSLWMKKPETLHGQKAFSSL